MIELNEAKKVVFIGYSLPRADYEFKYIIKKSIKPATEIDVILTSLDKTNGSGESAQEHYESFFDNKNLNFYFEGFENWVNSSL